jgi:O-antigen/teichoic acid export membrane protein
VLRQFLTLSAGEGAARALHVLAFFLIARGTGPSGLGAFGFAQAVASYGVFAVQRGLDVPAMLAAVQQPGRIPALRSAMVRLRLPVSFVLAAVALLSGQWLLAAMAGLWLGAATHMRWLLLAEQRGGQVALAAFVAGFGFAAAAALTTNLYWIAIGLSAGEMLGSAITWIGEKRGWGGEPSQAGQLAKQARPYLASLLLGNLLYNLDVFFLRGFRTNADVGLYLAAYRMITVFSPLLGAMQNATLPELGKMYPDTGAASALLRRIGVRALLTSIILAGSLVLLADPLLALAYGNGFGEASSLVRVLAWVLPVQVVRMLCRQAVFAFRGERADLRNLAWSVGVNAALDAALVPRFGPLGCAVSTIAAELVFAGLTLVTWRRLTCR